MYSTAERHNVNPKSTDCVLIHQQHPSMATRPDSLTVPMYRLDAILERKFEMIVNGLLLLKAKFDILTYTDCSIHLNILQNYRIQSYKNRDGSPYRNFVTSSLDINSTMEIRIAIPRRYHTLLWIEVPIALYAGN
jgi:uncharacterized protein YfbU (UPF0304 family)